MHWIDSSSRAIYFNESESRYHIQGYTPKMETEAWDSILEALCDPGHAGEMYTSAAPYDPTFWTLHTTAERLLQYRRIQADDGQELDETWGFDFGARAVRVVGFEACGSWIGFKAFSRWIGFKALGFKMGLET